MDYYVYMWVNRADQKRYVGKGRGRRAYDHLRAKGNGLLARAMRKHGVESFELSFLLQGLSEAEALLQEILAIYLFDATDPSKGYNLTIGGEGTSGWVAPPETRQRMSSAQKEAAKRPARAASYALNGERNRQLAQDPSWRAVNAARNRARAKDPAWVERAVVALRRSTEERRGKPKNPEHVEKSAATTRKRAAEDPAFHEKLSALCRTNADKRRGKPMSEEGRARVAEGQKRRRERERQEQEGTEL